MKKYLPAGADSTVWVATASLAAFLALVLALAGGITSLPTPAVAALYAVAGIVGLALLAAGLAKPIRYEARDESVTIVRSWPFPRITIPRSEIADVRHIRLESVVPTSLAAPGVFGYAGRFRSDEVGTFTLCATSLGEMVLIRATKSYVISPANPRRFVHELSEKK